MDDVVQALATGGIGAASLAALWWVLRRIGRAVESRRWTQHVAVQSVAEIAAERDRLHLRVHELELRLSSVEVRAAEVAAAAMGEAAACRAHAQRAIEERDRLARRIAGLTPTETESENSTGD